MQNHDKDVMNRTAGVHGFIPVIVEINLVQKRQSITESYSEPPCTIRSVPHMRMHGRYRCLYGLMHEFNMSKIRQSPP